MRGACTLIGRCPCCARFVRLVSGWLPYSVGVTDVATTKEADDCSAKSPALPDRFRDVEHLEEVMTAPTPELVAELAQVVRRHHHPGRRRQDRPDAGAAGQARRARTSASSASRASASRACARSSPRCGIECIAADLLDREQVEALPKLPNVIFMAGRKFGSSGARRPDLGDERACSGAGRRGLRRLAHRRLLDRLRLPLRRRRSTAARPRRRR